MSASLVGSEMCIRDSARTAHHEPSAAAFLEFQEDHSSLRLGPRRGAGERGAAAGRQQGRRAPPPTAKAGEARPTEGLAGQRAASARY
eukprot:5682477-Alexandrium_andersonii.AAC.1